MKFTATLCTLVATAALTSAAALDTHSYTTTLETRGAKWKDPQSWQGTCTADGGQCQEDSDTFGTLAACRNSAVSTISPSPSPSLPFLPVRLFVRPPTSDSVTN